MFVKTPRYLRKRIAGIQKINAGANTITQQTRLIVGDIDDNNVINLLDYGEYTDCFSKKNPAPVSPAPSVTPDGSKPSPCGQYGDVNLDGAVSQADANLVLEYVVGKQTPTDEQKRRADVDGNGIVQANDGAAILRYLNGVDATFPVCSGVSSACMSADLNDDGKIDTLTPTPDLTDLTLLTNSFSTQQGD